MMEVIIPFMNLNPIFTEKQSHYQIIRKVSTLLSKTKPLDIKTKLEIVELAYNANKKGKHREITKEAYIELLKEIHSDS